MTDANSVYLKFRERALAWRDPEAPVGSPSGVIMETGHAEGVSTLVVMSTGTVDLYFSHGAGVMGGGLYPGPANAGRELARAAMHFAPQMQPAIDLSMPKQGMVNIFVLIDGIVRGVTGKATDFGENRQQFSPLFHIGHRVIDELRRLPPRENPPPDANQDKKKK